MMDGINCDGCDRGDCSMHLLVRMPKADFEACYVAFERPWRVMERDSLVFERDALRADVEQLRAERERAINAYEDEHRRATLLTERVGHLGREVERLRACRDEDYHDGFMAGLSDAGGDELRRERDTLVVEVERLRAENEELRNKLMKAALCRDALRQGAKP